MRTLSSTEASFTSGGAAAPNNGNSGSQQCFSNGQANPNVTVCQNGNIQTIITCTTYSGSLSLNGKIPYGTLGGGVNGNNTTCTKTTTDLSTGKSNTIKITENDSADSGTQFASVDEDGNGYGDDSSPSFSTGISNDSIGGAGAHYNPYRSWLAFLNHDRSTDFA